MRLFQLTFFIFIGIGAVNAQTPPQAPKEGEANRESSTPVVHPMPLPNPPLGVKTEPENKPIPGFDATALDRNVDPCVDFYQYACGTWRAQNPIPPDRARWGRFDELRERNLAILRDILQQAAVNTAKRTASEQKIGDYYAACMDEKTIDQKGIGPIKPELDRIAALSGKNALSDEVARTHRIGANVLFRFGSSPDFENSDQMIAEADQGGLGLPDRDYYLKTDPKSVETRTQYRDHVQKTFELLGDAPDKAKAKAKVVIDIETALAKGSLDRVSRRDPVNIYHKMRRQELVASLDPSFGWDKYLAGVSAPPIETLNVAVPNFFKAVDSLIKTASLDDWKTYLTWRLVHSQSPLLPTAFVNENFNFYSKILTGVKELRPRWKRCVSFVDADLGEALGQKYVERTFGAEGKQRTLAMVQLIEKEMGKISTP